MTEQDRSISEAVSRDRPRLHKFIRKRMADPSNAEDILQEVFFELVEAYRMMQPIEQVSAWLFRVARNRITDLFRRRKREALRREAIDLSRHGEVVSLEDLIPSPDAGPEAAYARSVLLEELDDALQELPKQQREVFIAHELMGYSFKALADKTGVSGNTLLSRKRYAIGHLRERVWDAD